VKNVIPCKKTILTACASIMIPVYIIGMLSLGSCLRTNQPLELKGKITDELTGNVIPYRRVIIHARLSMPDKFIPVYTGQFMTDSSGKFLYSLETVTGAYNYDFSIVGDSDYLFKTERISFIDLKKNGQFMSFRMKPLTGLKIKINREGKKPAYDTLYLYWESDGNNGRGLAAYKVYNYGNPENYLGSSDNTSLRWVGGNVKSLITTRVLAGKKTVIYFELIRSGKRKVIIDTITCKRHAENSVYFKY